MGGGSKEVKEKRKETEKEEGVRGGKEWRRGEGRAKKGRDTWV